MTVILEDYTMTGAGEIDLVYINDPVFAYTPIQVPHDDFDLAQLEHDEDYAVLAP